MTEPMVRHIARLGLVLLLLPLVSHGATLADTIDKMRGGVVGVGTAYPPRQPNMRGKSSSLLGTGFVVADGLHIVTNAHVVPAEIDTDNKEMLAVFSGTGKSIMAHPAMLVSVDQEHDLALLRIDPPSLPALSIGDSSVIREGEDIAFTGFPIGAVLGLYPVTHRGIVSAITPIARPADTSQSLTATQIRRMRNPFTAFQLDAIAYPGNSGSPVYQPHSAAVVGVLNSVFIKESRESLLERPSGISYAIPAVHVKALLAASGLSD
tara:strand:- start:22234 stop:23028 length:795 start_codon:yes stop_codon:yes gene_type:complete